MRNKKAAVKNCGFNVEMNYCLVPSAHKNHDVVQQGS